MPPNASPPCFASSGCSVPVSSQRPSITHFQNNLAPICMCHTAVLHGDQQPLYAHFTEGQTEAQRGWRNCPRSHSSLTQKKPLANVPQAWSTLFIMNFQEREDNPLSKPARRKAGEHCRVGRGAPTGPAALNLGPSLGPPDPQGPHSRGQHGASPSFEIVHHWHRGRDITC